MKILIGSDFHFEFWRNQPNFFNNRLADAYEYQDIDHIVLAGDIDSDKDNRDGFIKALQSHRPVSFCLGNHDYYHGEWYDDKFEDDLFVGGCLWSDCWGNKYIADEAEKYINDFRLIKDWTAERMCNAFLDHKDHIFSSDREFVVTHFPPTPNGINPKFFGDRLNPYFHNFLENEIRKSNKKLWICGHNHWNFDYMIGDCRVVSNQFCYPGEVPRKKRWKVIEV